jgi:hypothetical protein
MSRNKRCAGILSYLLEHGFGNPETAAEHIFFNYIRPQPIQADKGLQRRMTESTLKSRLEEMLTYHFQAMKG